MTRSGVRGGLNARGRRSRFLGPVLVAVILVTLGSQGAGTAAAQPSPGDSFAYEYHHHVGNGGGEYEEWTEDTWSHGQYTILSRSTTEVRFNAVYSWTYRGDYYDHGREDRTVSFNLTTRHYTAIETDLDDYDAYDGRELAVWLWIPPEVRQGDSIQILDGSFLVVSLDALVWTNWAPKHAIQATTFGAGYRDDAYGQFSYTYTETYYFDRATGFIVAERYSEHDAGTWQGRAASFDWTDNVDVTASTYEIPIDGPVAGATLASIATVPLSLAGMGYAGRWWTRTVSRGKYVEHDAKVRRVRRMDDFPALDVEATHRFAPFLEDFARKALLAGDVLAVAVTRAEVVGFGVYNREAKIGMVLCANTAVTETLRKFIGAKDFFTELRHTLPEGLREEARRAGVKIDEPGAYNVFETYQVLGLDLAAAPRRPHDTALVSRMTEADLHAVGEVARRTYKARSDRWLRAQLRAGDIGFVARAGGKIVGFAFATCADGHGRVHTLTVLPEHRNAGIGKELMRARIEALRALGASDVVAEIADWNLPSLQIAWSHGFRRVGTMYVETARTTRVKRTIVRR